MPSSVAAAREAAIARSAARGDEAAVRTLAAAHADVCWRMAAVLCGADAAAGVVAAGFARALVELRLRRGLDAGVRPVLLAGTFVAAISQGPAGDEVVTGAPTAVALAAAALRSLPERWRAAVWLHEAEGLEPGTVALALDTSPDVALQLTVRGRRVVLDRLATTGTAPADGLGALLLEAVGAPPADLEAAVVTRCRAVAAMAAPPGWLAANAPRPLAAAAAGVVAIGFIGLGVLGSQAGVGEGIAVRAASAPGTSATAGLQEPGSALVGPLALLRVSTPAAPLPPGSTGAAPLLPAVAGGPAAGVAPPATATGPTTATRPPATTAPGRGGPTPTPAPGRTPPTTIVAAGPLSVTSGSGTTSVAVPPVVSAGVGSCTGLSAVGATVTVTCPAGGSQAAPTAAPTTAPAVVPVTVPAVGRSLVGLLGAIGAALRALR